MCCFSGGDPVHVPSLGADLHWHQKHSLSLFQETPVWTKRPNPDLVQTHQQPLTCVCRAISTWHSRQLTPLASAEAPSCRSPGKELGHGAGTAPRHCQLLFSPLEGEPPHASHAPTQSTQSGRGRAVWCWDINPEELSAAGAFLQKQHKSLHYKTVIPWGWTEHLIALKTSLPFLQMHQILLRNKHYIIKIWGLSFFFFFNLSFLIHIHYLERGTSICKFYVRTVHGKSGRNWSGLKSNYYKVT